MIKDGREGGREEGVPFLLLGRVRGEHDSMSDVPYHSIPINLACALRANFYKTID